MSQIYIAALIALLSGILPVFGFQITDSGTLSALILNLVTFASGSWALYRRVRAGDINALGIKKY